jgi:signal transduction histidine kinase/ligand-binding sensor domain-containing protein
LYRDYPHLTQNAVRLRQMGQASRPNPALRLLVLLFTCAVLLCAQTALALDPSLDVSQYAHTAWTVRDGFSLGNVYAIAQTPDGYLWLGSEFGLFRFDGVRSIPWQPPPGQQLPDRNINALLVTRDGALWIGTFGGLVTWSGGKLTLHSEEIGRQFVASLYEDTEGTVWAASLEPSGRLWTIRSDGAQSYGENGAFGRAIWALYQDNSGALWAAAQSGLWRLKPGPPRQYPTSTELIGLSKSEDGRLLIAIHGAGLLKLVGDKLESHPVPSAINSKILLKDRDVDANRVLRDRDGGLWIGTVERGLIHVHNGRTDVFRKADGLSGDVVLSIFEDREGNVWVSTTGGLDRFRELPVATVSVKQGLPSDAAQAVLAAADGTVWVASRESLTLLRNGQANVFGKASGLPDGQPESLFQDNSGRIWLSTRNGVAYFKDGRFTATGAIRSGEVHYITGDKAGDLWLSENKGLLHLRDGRFVDQIPWSALGRHQQANVVLADREGGVWLGFWVDGGVSYLKNGQLRVTYTTADGLGQGPVPDLRLDLEGVLWAGTEYGGLSRIKDGRIATLTTRNGLPCNTINGTIEDDDRSTWLYTGCGLVRIQQRELDAWIADPKSKVEMTVWAAADGVRLRSSAASEYGPRLAKSTDGKLWFVTGEGVQVVDPHHLAFNKIQPPVHVEQIVADHKNYWQNITGTASNLHLPPRTRDLQIDYTALSLVAPEKVHFKYKLEGQDPDWREVVNDRQVEYSNLAPGHYRFRVMACNNSGVWNEQGDTLEFSVAPAYYQTNWFRALCVAAFLTLLWALYQMRLRQLARQFNVRLEERVGERTRIARDLHDTLLQSFHGILLHFQTGINLLPEHSAEPRTAEARRTFEKTMQQAKHAIVEGREAIQGLRSSTFEPNDLAIAIRTVGGELAADSNSAAFQVDVEGTPRNLHPIVRDEVYRIAGEGIRNAFRHADARRIEVEIHYDERHLRVRVRDDGKGIDPKLISDDGREGHFGLRGMRERAKLIGGKLTVWSDRGTGTEVELSIPASCAYTASTEGNRMRIAEKFLAKLSGRGTTKYER